MFSTVRGSGREVEAAPSGAGPSERAVRAIAACAHFAALPCLPCAETRPARMCARNSAGVAAAGDAVNVRPMSTPA